MAGDTADRLAAYVRVRRLRAGLTQEGLVERAGLTVDEAWRRLGLIMAGETADRGIPPERRLQSGAISSFDPAYREAERDVLAEVC